MKLRWIALLPLALALVLGGCAFLEDTLGIGKPDLIVKSVEPLVNSDGALTGVRMVLANTGSSDASGAQYLVCLTTDSTISMTNDPVIYRSSTDLGAGSERQIDLDGEADISPWMDSNDFDYDQISSSTKYFIGVKIDPNSTIDEKSETNNEATTSTSFLMTGGTGSSISVSGTLTLPPGLITQTWDFLASGTHTIYVGAVDPNFTATSGSTLAYADVYEQGFTQLSINYNATSGTNTPFTFTVPAAGEYMVIAVVDDNSDGTLSVAPQGPPTEPWAVLGTLSESSPPSVVISSPMTGVSMQFMDLTAFGYLSNGGFSVSGYVNPTTTTISNVTGIVRVAAVSAAALVHRANLALDVNVDSYNVPVDYGNVAAVQSWPNNPTGSGGSWPGQQTYTVAPLAGGYLCLIAFVDTNNDGHLSFDASGNPLEPATGWDPAATTPLWYDNTVASWSGPSLFSF